MPKVCAGSQDGLGGGQVRSRTSQEQAPPTTRRVGSRVSSVLSVESRTKSIEDLYNESGDDKVIRDMTYTQIQEAFPMACYCSPDGPVRPCRFQPLGHSGRLPLLRKLVWAWPCFGFYALMFLKIGYMRKFYVDDYPKASLGIIAFSSVLSVLVDAFTDPKMATWTDNLKSKYGRRRPFILVSALFVPLVFILAWLPLFVSSGFAASIWYGFFHIMFKLANTLFMIPLEAWGAQLTPVYKEKTNVWQWKDIIANVGLLFGMALAPMIFLTEQCTSTPDGGCWELPLITLVFGGFFTHACWQLCWWGKEPATSLSDSQHEQQQQQQPKHSVFLAQDTIPTLIATFLNKPFRILLLSDIAKALGQEIPFNVLPFFTAWVLGEKCFSSGWLFGRLALLNIVAGLIGVPCWTALASKTSKYHAYVAFNCSLAVTSMSFILLRYDDDYLHCPYSTMAFVLCASFGFAYGGTFIINSLVSDVVDYDEFLTGGRRREASYMMALGFLPKFMNIPGECVPFLLMAYFKYARPVPAAYRPACMNKNSPDAWCSNYFLNETLDSERRCSESISCQELFDTGVRFVCNSALGDVGDVDGKSTKLGECGLKQNSGVQWVLILCFTVVPCFFIMCGIIGLYFYPKNARSESMHEKLVQATSRLRRGEVVEDPWRPGSFVHPSEPPTENAGALSYFTPSELKAVVDAGPLAGGLAKVSPLLKRALLWSSLFVAFVPAGGIVVGLGLEDLSDDLGASVSPLGLMGVGLGICGLWFNGVRATAAMDLKRNGLQYKEVVAKFNEMCPFTGATRLPTGDQQPALAKLG